MKSRKNSIKVNVIDTEIYPHSASRVKKPSLSIWKMIVTHIRKKSVAR